jgi:hypothetical protein
VIGTLQLVWLEAAHAPASCHRPPLLFQPGRLLKLAHGDRDASSVRFRHGATADRE